MSLPNKINLTILVSNVYKLKSSYLSGFFFDVKQMTVQVVWRLLMLASRVLALTLFITIFERHIIYVLGIHWLIMFLWILSMRTRFCDHRIEEVIYNALIGVMFIFCYFNPIVIDTRFSIASCCWKILCYFIFGIPTLHLTTHTRNCTYLPITRYSRSVLWS